MSGQGWANVDVAPEGTIKKLRAENERLRGALEKITVPEGAFSMDRLTHAENTIEWVIDTAKAALERSE